ncbi:FG-GAP-like repeat-containing protein [Microbacterium sp. Be9]|uniref:FG-GAP-like repeat-containing protein n=1 Tax=Microbacterium sp. Be9 TaxID=2720211 RepID=UPI00141E6EAB|nr:FG-GAP-like repeat-containing protein [Microbacterium sp. Be9]NIG65540.1 peptidoglycan DD-metalloendopeptidase family protein [Microbacterium sp. Be9]
MNSKSSMARIAGGRKVRAGFVALVVAVALVYPQAAAPEAASAAPSDSMVYPASGNIQSKVGDGCRGNYRKHDGIDISGQGGTPIVAAADGTIKSKSSGGSYGNLVEVQHAGGYVTRYAHMASATPFAVGTPVSQGTPIGVVGNTGNSPALHLHFEVYRNGALYGQINDSFTCLSNVTRGTWMPGTFPGLGGAVAPPVDTDGDGIPNVIDVCPASPGVSFYEGCPIPRSANNTDFTGDGIADVFFSHPNGQWWVSENGTSAWNAINTGGVAPGVLQFADFDGDGKSDVFWPDPATGNWYVSYGGTTAWALLSAANGTPGHELQLGDFNGDGKADVFWANAGTNQWWISYGGNSAWTITATSVPATSLRIADLTGDGKDDVFYAHPNGQWWLSESGASSWQIINTAGISAALLKFGDIDGDGKDDVLLPNPATGNWQVSYGGTTAWSLLTSANVPGEQLQLADLTGDGKADVFWPNIGVGQWWMSSGAASSWQAINSAAVDHNLLVVR